MGQLLAQSGAEAAVAALYESSWVDLLSMERPLAVAGLFEAQGRGLHVSAALDLVILESLGLAAPDRGVIYPLFSADPMAASKGQNVDGMALAGIERARQVLVPTICDGRTVLLLVDRGSLSSSHCEGLDPDLGLFRVTGQCTAVEEVFVEDGDWQYSMALGRLALASEALGLAEEMLAIGIRHVTDREQFGRPIGTFQSVKHRLADCYVEISATRHALYDAWRTPTAFSAAAAKAQAGQTALLAATHVQQVCGAMGWTWEYELHRYIRRAHVLDALLGDSAALQRELGYSLLASASVPRVGGLAEVSPL
jgi:hypothetical protein